MEFFFEIGGFGSHKGLGLLLYHAVLQKVMHFIMFSPAITELLQGVARGHSYEGVKSSWLSTRVAS